MVNKLCGDLGTSTMSEDDRVKKCARTAEFPIDANSPRHKMMLMMMMIPPQTINQKINKWTQQVLLSLSLQPLLELTASLQDAFLPQPAKLKCLKK